MIPFAATIVKALLGPVTDIAGKYIDKQANKDKLAAELEAALAAAATDLARVQGDVIMAEARSESVLARNWRPVAALLFVWIVFWFGFVQPLLVGWFDLPPLRVGDPLLLKILDLVTICLGGYIGGRTVEKVFRR